MEVVSWLYIETTGEIMFPAIEMAGKLPRFYDEFIANQFMYLRRFLHKIYPFYEEIVVNEQKFMTI